MESLATARSILPSRSKSAMAMPRPLPGLSRPILCGDLGEVAFAVVVVDEGGDGVEDIGMAVGAVAFAVFAAPDVVEVPLHVAEDDEVEEAVVVEIDPGGGGGPVWPGVEGPPVPEAAVTSVKVPSPLLW